MSRCVKLVKSYLKQLLAVIEALDVVVTHVGRIQMNTLTFL